MSKIKDTSVVFLFEAIAQPFGICYTDGKEKEGSANYEQEQNFHRFFIEAINLICINLSGRQRRD